MVKRPSTPPNPNPGPSPSSSKARLSREDWIGGSINAVMADGIDALAVEPMAARLGTTKGSFYWHFRDRAELLDVVLERWEALATRSLIEDIAKVDDPAERLRVLLDVVFAGAEEDRFELAMFSEAEHPQVRPVVERVTAARMTFLQEIFVEMGLTPARARTRARIAYAIYLGHLQLRILDPGGAPTPRAIRRFTDDVFAMFVPTEDDS